MPWGTYTVIKQTLQLWNIEKNQSKAIICYLNALKYESEQNSPKSWAMTLFALGSLYKNRLTGETVKNKNKAVEYFQKAIGSNKITKENSPDQYSILKWRLGITFLELNDIAGQHYDGLHEINQGLEVIKKRMQTLDPEAGKHIWKKNRHFFKDVISSLLKYQYFKPALFYMETLKSHNMLIDIDLEAIPKPGGKAQKTADDYWQICRTIRSIRAQINFDWTKNKNTLLSRLEKFANRQNALLSELKMLAPEYVRLIRPEAACFNDLIKLIKSRKTAAVSFWIENMDIHILTIYKSCGNNLAIDHKSVRITNNFIDLFVQFFNNPICIKNKARSNPLSNLLSTAGDIFQEFFTWLEDIDVENIYLSPHGILQSIPLHGAWIKKKNCYANDCFNISYLPSLTMGVQLIKTQKSLGNQTLALFYEPGDMSNRLSHGYEEFKNLSTIYEKNKPINLTKQDATFENLSLTLNENKNKIQNMFISCHGYADKSGFYLRLKDGDVHYSKMANRLNLQGIHVSLNACSTGASLSWLEKEDEYFALDHIFHLMGAKSCISCFYPIYDSSTSIITQNMHKLLNRKIKPFEAFNRSVKEFKNNKLLFKSDQKRLLSPGRQNPPEFVNSDHPVFWVFLKYSGVF